MICREGSGLIDDEEAEISCTEKTGRDAGRSRQFNMSLCHALGMRISGSCARTCQSPMLAQGCRSAMSDRLGCPLSEGACAAAIASSDIQEPAAAAVAIQHFDEAGLDCEQRRGLIASFAAARVQTTALQRVSGMVFSLVRQAVRCETGKTTEGQTKLTPLGEQRR